MKNKLEIFLDNKKITEIDDISMIHSMEVWKEGEHPDVMTEGVIRTLTIAIGKETSLWKDWKGLILRYSQS